MSKTNNSSSRGSLKPNQLRQRFLRHRNAWSLEDQLDEEFYYDEWWDELDPATPFDYVFYQALEMVRWGLGFGTLKGPLDAAGLGFLTSASGSECDAADIASLPIISAAAQERLAKDLSAHVALLDSKGLDRDKWLATIASSESIRRRLAELADGASEAEQQSLAIAFLFSPFWVRSLEEWMPGRRRSQGWLRDLLNHLFVQFSVPEFLWHNWVRDSGKAKLKWSCWLILLGRGASLYRSAEHFGWRMSKAFAHHLSNAPPHCTGVEACVWAEVQRVNGSEMEYRRLLAQPGYVVDVTSQLEPEFRKFWNGTLEWLIEHRLDLNDQQAEMILEWALHAYTEGRRNQGAGFSWGQRGAVRTLQLAEEYRRKLKHPYLHYRWQGQQLDWKASVGGANWEVTELLNGEVLCAEGEAMHHCVSLYACRCLAGTSAIFSLRRDGVRMLTIETDPKSRRLVQVRGAYNRQPDASEEEVVSLWWSTVGMRRDNGKCSPL